MAAMRRAVALADAWHPNVYPLPEFRELVGKFRSISGAENRSICVRIALNSKSEVSEIKGPRGETRLLLSGNMTENRKTISELEKLGVSYALVSSSPDGKVNTSDQVESLRQIAEEFIGK